MATLQQYESDEVETHPIVTIATGIIFAFIGILLGAFHLVMTPVEEASARTTPEDIVPGKVYYWKGSTRNAGSWQIKLEQFTSGSANLSLVEGELNAWARRDLKVKTPKDQSGFIQAKPSNVNFKIEDDTLQYACQYLMSAPMERQIIYQAKGGFIQGENGPVFNPTTSYINSCPIPPVANLPIAIFAKMGAPFTGVESYKSLRTAWKGLSEASVADNRLTLKP